MSSFCRINDFGFIETPYRVVVHDVEPKKAVDEIAREDIEVGGKVIVKAGDKITKADADKMKELETVPVKPRVTDEIVYIDAFTEEKATTTSATTAVDENGYFVEDRAEVRYHMNPMVMPVEVIDYMDVSPKQIVSISTALIPFLEHDDAVRALMGTNMQRQALPTLF